jgi:hypothetical protein
MITPQVRSENMGVRVEGGFAELGRSWVVGRLEGDPSIYRVIWQEPKPEYHVDHNPEIPAAY